MNQHVVTYFSQSLSVATHVCKNNQNVLLTLVRQELCSRQRNSWRNDTLNPTQTGNTYLLKQKLGT